MRKQKKRLMILLFVLVSVAVTTVSTAGQCPDLGCNDPDPIELLNCLNKCP